MKEYRKIPPVYQDHDKIEIHLDIRSAGAGHKYQMLIKGVGHIKPYYVDMLLDDLYQLNEDLREAFQGVVNNKDDQGVINELAKAGHNAFLKIFEKKAREDLRKLLSYSTNTTIEITTEDFFLPWELLYLESPEKTVSIDNFLGARYIISRIIDMLDTPFIGPYITQAIPRLGLLTNNELEFVRSREIPFFDRLNRERRITLLKLGILNPDNHQEGMMRFEVFLTNPLDIAHFACHAVGDKKHDLSSMILSENFEIKLIDLRSLDTLQMSDNPIVMLNACGTGNINSKYASFFAKEFLKYGARAVIATDCEVPDFLAAEFSEKFYSEFLDGTPIGEALFNTRRYFLDRSNELAVLIYSMYGEPMIKIANRQLVHVTGEQNG